MMNTGAATFLSLLCSMGVLTIPVVFLVLVISIVRGSFNRTRGKKLQDELRHRGYTWLTLDDARLLYQELGKRAWQIPPYEELGVVPGVEEGCVETLLEVMERR